MSRPTRVRQAAEAFPRSAFLGPPLLALAPVAMTWALPQADMAPGHALRLAILFLVTTAIVQVLLSLVAGPARATTALLCLLYLFFLTPWQVGLPAVLIALVWIGLAVRRPDLVVGISVPIGVLLAIPGLLWPLVATLADRPPEAEPWAAEAGSRPDIWWIVLDGYSRRDVLASRYGVEEGLADALEQRAFHIAPQSRANYAQTMLYLASTLNAAPLETLDLATDEVPTRRSLLRLIRNNRVTNTLSHHGYTVVQYAPEYAPARIRADVHRGPLLPFTEIENAMVQISPLPLLGRVAAGRPGWLGYWRRRAHLRSTLDDLGRHRPADGPVFTFAHILAPHPPFVFHADGTSRASSADYALFDGSTWQALHGADDAAYAEGYVDMVRWLDTRVLEAVDRILTRDPEAIVVVQSDHGGARHLNWDSVERTDLVERMAILTAVHAPGWPADEVPSDLTPIDTARLVLSLALDVDLPLLQPPSLFSPWDSPFDMVDVTGRLGPPHEGE